MEFEIEFYEARNGQFPALSYIESLSKKDSAAVFSKLSLLESGVLQGCEQHMKNLSDGIFELRVKASRNQYRVLFFYVIGRKIILTNGFLKKTSKVPKRHLDLALTYKKDYLENSE